MRVKQYVGIILLTIFVFSISNPLVVAMNVTKISNTDVEILSIASLNYETIIKTIRIKNETILLAGLNVSETWKKFNWRNINNETCSFEAEWVTRAVKVPLNKTSAGEYNHHGAYVVDVPTVTIRDDIFDEYLNNNMFYTFHSLYNGTHFLQAIILWKADLTNENTNIVDYFVPGGGSCKREDLHGLYYGYAGVNLNITEVNRTVYSASSVDSPYNPTNALYNAILFMRQHKYAFLNEENTTNRSFINAENIFLVPRELIPDYYPHDVPFLWYIHFAKEIHFENDTINSNKNDYDGEDIFYRVVVLPNGTVLGEEHVVFPFIAPLTLDTASNYSSNSSYITETILIIAAITIIAITVLMIHLITKKKSFTMNNKVKNKIT